MIVDHCPAVTAVLFTIARQRVKRGEREEVDGLENTDHYTFLRKRRKHLRSPNVAKEALSISIDG